MTVAISLSYGVIVKLRKENLSLTLAFTYLFIFSIFMFNILQH